MNKEINEKIKKLIGNSITNISSSSVTSDDTNISINLSSGTNIQTTYWRILKEGFRISSFDHNQKYGLPKMIDAIGETKKHILNMVISKAEFIELSGDIKLVLNNNVVLEVFNFSGYEVWEIEFEDGTGQYSNYV